MIILIALHLLVFIIRPLRELYCRALPHSALFSVGLLGGWLVGCWIVAFGAPAYCAIANALIWGFGLVGLAADTGWARRSR